MGEMVERVIRSTRHPKLPNTFERLRAQAEERNATNPIQDWLEQTSLPPPKAYPPSHPSHNHIQESSEFPLAIHSTRQLRLRSRTVDALALQPTHGNRLPRLPTSPHPPASPPPSIYLSRKRKMPDSSDTIPRQSARTKKNIQSKPADDGPGVKGKGDVATRVSQRLRRVDGQTKEGDIFNMPGAALEEGEPFKDDRSLAKGKGPSNDSVFGKRFVKLPMASSTPSKTSSSPSKRSGSPSKGPIVVNKNERMKFMEPRILFKTLSETNKSGYLTGKIQKLWQHTNWYERRVIPSAFKMELNKELDTPNKTKPLVSDECFGALHDRYAADDYSLMRLTIADVLELADEYRYSGCTEAHWTSIVVSPLLNLVRRLKRYQKKDSKLAVLDLTAVEISPSTLCPTSSDSLFKDLDKRIDAAIGLNLPSEKRSILETGVYTEGVPSINQTASFVNFIPMFANVEIKRPNTDRDPLIQLGTWIAAEFKKRKKEGYSLDMPVLAIAIEGDAWDLHMVFAREDVDRSTFECRFVGPIEMGTTKSLLGIYQILDRLCRCADWGIGEYQTWFNERVLAKYEQ